MRYNDGSKGYLSSVVNDLRDARNTLKIIYNSSLYRAEKEGTSLSVALINNLKDVYHKGLDSLLIPVGVYDGVVAYEPQNTTRLPTEFFMGSKSTKHKRPTSNKQKKEQLRKKRKRKEHRNW